MEHTQEAAGTAPMTLANQVNAVKEQIEKLLSSVMDYRSQEGVWPGDLQPERFDACCRLLELLASPSCIEGRFVRKINYPHLRLRLQSGANARQSSLASPDFRWPDTGSRLRLQLRVAPATEAGGEDEAALEVELLLLQSTVQQRPLRARLQARLIDLRDPSCGGLTGQSETFSIDQTLSELGDHHQRACCVLRDWPAKLGHLRNRLDAEGGWQFVKSSCAYLEAIVTEVQQ
ncbi:hypothetical protein BOX15_Mlig021137g1 [Macrostomum lignano]|uniref:Mab-21 domain-containing protein n=2 Tax=Macrostomum lignano TaxID=282301 RepID=A0A1I8HCG0_9PLAT|nr:hypothetical protein BOX15_Mlig021137g1 [Macrostomum lignano]